MEQNLKPKADNDLIGDHEMRATFNHVVDYIMAKRVGLNGKVEYLVKWEGWPSRTATWEPSANFASPQIIEIFESGLREQMGEQELELTSVEPISTKTKTRSGSKRKTKWSEPMATKFCEDLRKKSKKLRKGNPNKDISPHKLFGVYVNRIERVIKRYEPLVGASKRKSRMSCPSSPKRVKVSPKPLVSDRSQRYRMRHEFKSDNSLSNTSIEENKNPLNGNFIQSGVLSNLKTQKTPKNMKRQMKVNNDSNKMINKLSQSLYTETTVELNPESQDNTSDQKGEDSPSKVFINKVKERLFPEEYQTFLNQIIDFQSINLEFSRVLNNNEELIRGLFDILSFNRDTLLKDKDGIYGITTIYPTKIEGQIDEHIDQWYEKVDKILETKQKEMFWVFIENKEKSDILKASPDNLWLTINSLLSNHKDLSEEFKKFMPTLCSKVHDLYSHN